MASRTDNSRPRLHRTADPLGYRIGEEQRQGFVDDPRLTRGQRLRIAGWARALTPEALSSEQEALLDAAAPPPTEAQKRAAELSGFEASPYWKLLDERQRTLVRDPASHPDLDGAGYPLGVGQLADLVGATPEKVRHWHNSGLLPAQRTSGRHREFYAAAAVRAFYLNGLSRSGITILRDLARGEGGALLLGVSAVLHDRASAAPAAEHELLRRTATNLEQVGADMLAAD
jgi:DNA-binding transcriptional MerR regulator